MMWNLIYKIEDKIEKLFGNNTKWERAIYKFFKGKIPSCGHYDRFEQCCNDYRYCEDDTGLCFCESGCPYGVNGEIRLPLSRFILNGIKILNSKTYRILNKGK